MQNILNGDSKNVIPSDSILYEVVLGISMRVRYLGDISASYYQRTKPIYSVTYTALFYLQAY